MSDSAAENEKIDRYIDATRLNYGNRINVDLYQRLYFPPVQAMADHFGVPLHLKIAYSSTRRAEHVTIGAQRWLVYDQYMGQSMNLLNRIFIEAEGEEPGIVYFHKVFAERLLEIGHYPEALYCAKVYNSERAILQPKHVNEELRSLFTAAQERFYLYHELGHQVYGIDHFSCITVRGHVHELIEDRKDRLQHETADVLIAAFQDAPPAASHHVSKEEIDSDIRMQFESESGVRYRAAGLKALEDKDLQEEVFCDVFASDLTSAAADAGDQEHVQQVIRAIYVGFYHLQVLSFIDRFLGRDKAGDWQWLDLFAPIQVRSHCLRAHLLFVLGLKLGTRFRLDPAEVDAKVDAFSIQLMEDQKRYYDVIFDPVIKLVEHFGEPGELARLGQAEIAPVLEKTPSLADPANAVDLITALDAAARMMTGWPLRRSS